ncbi:hypothetical protein [Arthrobacter sp. NEB 688]|uniref:hypothetical protein n=1 Tax=Arthrobacter sp. NEB 688 TaxID=904039 RepID=UPI0015675081|nr:hypothetical protein [Arthrobacter sp. NEB 688]QKE82742.1 hypothetical protein HL663_01425 [Arthrobacter sp. NEB 688]
MARRLGALLLGLSLTALAGCGSTSATAGADGTAPVPRTLAPAPAGPSTGLTAIQGTVLGLPDGERATVHLEIWPADDDTKVGEAVDIRSTPEVETDPSGHWSVAIDPSDLGRKYFSTKSPVLNVDVAVRAGDVGASWSVPLWFLVADGVWRSDQYATIDDRVVDLTMDLAAQQVTTTSSVGESETQALPVMPFTAPSG